MTRVLIAAPVKQDRKTFTLYQDSLHALRCPDGVSFDTYFVVNDCPGLIPLIKGEYEECNTGDYYQKTLDTHIWTERNLGKMPLLRNKTIKRALDGGYDYLFSVDSDLVLHPDTLSILLEAKKDIVAELFWTQTWPNAWMYDQCDCANPKWAEPGLYEVGMTGACILISRKVLEAGVDYSPIPNIRYLYGEDRFFCIRAACHGFALWADSHCPPYHLYTQKELSAYLRQRGAD